MGERYAPDRPEITEVEANLIRNLDAVFAIESLVDRAGYSVAGFLSTLVIDILPTYDPELFVEYLDRLAASEEPDHKSVLMWSMPAALRYAPELTTTHLERWRGLFKDADPNIAGDAMEVFFHSLPGYEADHGMELITPPQRAELEALAETIA